ncbi:unnamed protein product [Ilex paraguariensis]|uniref:Phytocyanin domain-containing protein n=1 Tax=Ilex paraguariensis TaxID=185542 RepID=A0ABC8T2Q4_9AQUA
MAISGGGLVCLMAILCSAVPCLATVYTVGDAGGWALGSDYTSWTTGKTFSIGDSLVFNYVSGHTLDEVSASDYKTCTVGNSISTDNSGSTTVSLNTAGTHYFICGVIGHCGSGMKLAVTVTGGGGGGATTSPSGTSPTLPSSSTTSPAPPTNTLCTPSIYSTVPGFSSSRTLSPFMAVVITFVVMFKLVLSQV